MPFNLVFKAVAPAFLSENRVKGMLLSTLQKRAKAIKADFEVTTQDWEVPVEFYSRVRYAGGDASVESGTNNPIWKFLNYGTQERWAIMPKGFVPLSTVGQISSTPPGGKPVRRGRKQMPVAQTGITAREWTKVIAEKHQPELTREVGRVLSNLLVAQGLKMP